MKASIFQPSCSCLDVTLLVLPGVSLLTLASAVDPLRAANRVTGREVFRSRLVSADGAPAVASCGMPVAVDGALEPATVGDVLCVAAAFDAREGVGRGLRTRLHGAHRRAVATGGLESGAWVLARAGLLEGRAATTHWEDLEDLASAFPEVDVRPDRYVIDGSVFTTGGASPTLDLMLHLIASRCGHDVALDVGGVFGYQVAHAGAAAQVSVVADPLIQAEPRLAHAIGLMERCLDAPPAVAAIARRVGVTPRTLDRLFRDALDTTPGRYFAHLRLNAARRMVMDTRLPVTLVAVRTGFSSASTFARAFRRHHGIAASEMRAAGMAATGR